MKKYKFGGYALLSRVLRVYETLRGNNDGDNKSDCYTR